MQCFVGGRQTGKTWQLICLSHDTGYPIVTRTANTAKRIEQMARRAGKTIPKPICYASREMLIGSPMRRNVLVDESQGILEDVLNAHIVAASIQGEALALCKANPAIGSMGLIELLRRWNKERKQENKHE